MNNSPTDLNLPPTPHCKTTHFPKHLRTKKSLTIALEYIIQQTKNQKMTETLGKTLAYQISISKSIIDNKSSELNIKVSKTPNLEEILKNIPVEFHERFLTLFEDIAKREIERDNSSSTETNSDLISEQV